LKENLSNLCTCLDDEAGKSLILGLTILEKSEEEEWDTVRDAFEVAAVTMAGFGWR
jgi:hypothetical protein